MFTHWQWCHKMKGVQMTREQIKQVIQNQIETGRSLFHADAQVDDVMPIDSDFGTVTITTTDHEGKNPQKHRGSYIIRQNGIRVAFSWKSKKTFFCPLGDQATDQES